MDFDGTVVALGAQMSCTDSLHGTFQDWLGSVLDSPVMSANIEELDGNVRCSSMPLKKHEYIA